MTPDKPDNLKVTFGFHSDIQSREVCETFYRSWTDGECPTCGDEITWHQETEEWNGTSSLLRRLKCYAREDKGGSYVRMIQRLVNLGMDNHWEHAHYGPPIGYCECSGFYFDGNDRLGFYDFV